MLKIQINQKKVIIPFSIQEGYSTLKKTLTNKSFNQDGSNNYINLSRKLQDIQNKLNLLSKSNSISRQVTSLFFRFRLNALKTKFSKDIKCICGNKFHINHFLFNCQDLKPFLPKSFTDLLLTEDKLFDLLHNTSVLCDIVTCLIESPILPLL